jgi:hypothetical protein
MQLMFRCLITALLALQPLVSDITWAADQEKDEDRLKNCGVVLKEILNVPDDIPQDLLDKADCVVIYPSVLKAAFIRWRELRTRRNDLPQRREFSGALGCADHDGSRRW